MSLSPPPNTIAVDVWTHGGEVCARWNNLTTRSVSPEWDRGSASMPLTQRGMWRANIVRYAGDAWTVHMRALRRDGTLGDPVRGADFELFRPLLDAAVMEVTQTTQPPRLHTDRTSRHLWHQGVYMVDVHRGTTLVGDPFTNSGFRFPPLAFHPGLRAICAIDVETGMLDDVVLHDMHTGARNLIIQRSDDGTVFDTGNAAQWRKVEFPSTGVIGLASVVRVGGTEKKTWNGLVAVHNSTHFDALLPWFAERGIVFPLDDVRSREFVSGEVGKGVKAVPSVVEPPLAPSSPTSPRTILNGGQVRPTSAAPWF
jgi:hypothetical protein